MPLRENCPITEFFLVHTFPYLDWIRRDTKYPSIFSPNAGKYGPEKTPYLDIFHAVCFMINSSKLIQILVNKSSTRECSNNYSSSYKHNSLWFAGNLQGKARNQQHSGSKSINISSHPVVFCKKGVLKNVAKLTGEHLC